MLPPDMQVCQEPHSRLTVANWCPGRNGRFREASLPTSLCSRSHPPFYCQGLMVHRTASWAELQHWQLWYMLYPYMYIQLSSQVFKETGPKFLNSPHAMLGSCSVRLGHKHCETCPIYVFILLDGTGLPKLVYCDSLSSSFSGQHILCTMRPPMT
eukprot:jgi/Ulvmu1/3008/UM015_0048.1